MQSLLNQYCKIKQTTVWQTPGAEHLPKITGLNLSVFATVLLLGILHSLPGHAVEGDIDNDSVPDEIDLDADNDAIPNVFEGTVDTDGDGLPDYLDLDSDNDSIPDIRESILNRPLLLMLDSNGDGLVDAGVELGDNGFVDIVEALTDAGTIDFRLPDSDRDGILNFRDLDSDNDGLSDRIELRNLTEFVLPQIATIVDGNRNGLDDTVTALNAFFDTDGDLAENAYDLDSDNDGLSDLLETAGLNLDQDNNGQVDQFDDLNGNGYADLLDNAPLQASDFDNDGVPNHLDLDSDNDGTFDIDEFLQSGTVTGPQAPVTVSTNPQQTPATVPPIPANDGITNVGSDLIDANTGSGLGSSDTEIAQTIITSGISGSALGGCSISAIDGQSHWTNALQWWLLLVLLFLFKHPLKRARHALARSRN